jgi:ATP phosphoribosyltransferase
LHLSRSKDQLFCRAEELPLDILFVRDDDIPSFVSEGVCELGIVGENVWAEQQADGLSTGAELLRRLGFSACRLALAAPDSGEVNRAEDLAGRRIATSYPALTRQYFDQLGLMAQIVTMAGAVEVAPRMKIADAICDIVATGGTLASNGLREVATVLQSEALLIGRVGMNEGARATVDRLMARMIGVQQAEDSKYIMLHAPRANLAAVTSLLPGAETPTILPLEGNSELVALHAVCREGVFWDTMERLKAAGASTILVMPIEKML